MEFGGEGREIPRDLMCPNCTGNQAGRLWRHGWYERFFKSELSELKPILILRLRCSKCGGSQACLYDFLVPYRQCSAELLGGLVWRYLLDGEMVYEEYEWASADGKGHRNLVFTVIEKLCQVYAYLGRYVAEAGLRPGESLWERAEPEPDAECANSSKAKKEGKRVKLNQVAAVLMRFKRQSGRDGAGNVFGFLQRAGMRLRLPISLLTGAKVVRLYAPHSLECGLF